MSEMAYIPVPNFVMTHPELTSVDVMIYVSIQKEQNRIGKPLTKWSQYQNILDNVNKGGKTPKKGKRSPDDKITMATMFERIKKMEDLRILQKEDEDIYLRLDSTTTPIFKRSL